MVKTPKMPKLSQITSLRKISLDKLSVRQVSIIIVAVSVIICFMFVWIYIYIPIKADYKMTAAQLEAVDKRINEVLGYIPRGETTQEQIDKLKEESRSLAAKLPAEEAASMRMLMDFIRALDIEVGSTKTANRKLLLDEDNAKIIIDDHAVEVVLITIRLKTTYKGLVELIGALRESVPAYMSVQRLLVDAPREQTDKLDATLDMNLYLLTKQNE